MRERISSQDNSGSILALGYGPGTELKQLFAVLGFHDDGECNCEADVIRMDNWGVAGCIENFDLICEWITAKAIRRGLDSAGIADAVKEAIRRAEVEAIRRAEVKETES